MVSRAREQAEVWEIATLDKAKDKIAALAVAEVRIRGMEMDNVEEFQDKVRDSTVIIRTNSLLNKQLEY